MILKKKHSFSRGKHVPLEVFAKVRINLNKHIDFEAAQPYSNLVS